MIVKKGEWVQIHRIVLEPKERTGKLPEETKKVPLELWVKGFLNEDSKIGDTASITTVTGRMDRGILEEINSNFTYGFGKEFIPELLQIDMQVKKILQEGDN